MNRAITYSLLMGVTLLGGCQFAKPVDLDLAFDHTTLVVQAFVSPQDGFLVSVMPLLPPTNAGQDSLGPLEAEVAVYENNQFLTQLVKNEDQLYVLPSRYRVVDDASYHIIVSAPNYQTVTSEVVTIPVATPITSVELVEDNEMLRWSFEDPKGVENYYFSRRRKFTDGVDEYALGPGEDWFFNPYLSYDDVGWDGEVYVAQWRVYFTEEVDSLGMQHYHISPLLFEYMEAIGDQDVLAGNPLVDLGAFPTNLVGGVGLLGAYSFSESMIIP